MELHYLAHPKNRRENDIALAVSNRNVTVVLPIDGCDEHASKLIVELRLSARPVAARFQFLAGSRQGVSNRGFMTPSGVP